MVTTYRVGIAHAADGSAAIWALDLPGCRAVGGSADEAKALLPIAVAEHLAWLRRHGEKAEEEARFDFVEEVDQRGEWLFEADKEPLTAADLETALRHIAYAQADLVDLAKALPAAVLEWKPPPTSVRIDAIFPDVRSIAQMLEHVATTESRYYIGSLSQEAPAPAQGQRAEIFELKEATEARLRALTDEQRRRVYTRDTGPRGHWTARKVLRRIVAHKRFHTREIEQRLCWLTLGVPVVLQGNRE